MCRDFVKQSRVAITTLLFLASAQATRPMLRFAIIWKYRDWLINKIPKWESFFFLFSAIKWQGGGGGWGVLVVAMCWQRFTLMYTVHGGFQLSSPFSLPKWKTQPIRATVSRNYHPKNAFCWQNNTFLFSAENWEGHLVWELLFGIFQCCFSTNKCGKECRGGGLNSRWWWLWWWCWW